MKTHRVDIIMFTITNKWLHDKIVKVHNDSELLK